MKYVLSVKRYSNSVDKVRFNISYVSKHREKMLAEQLWRPCMGGSKPGRRVRPLGERDRSNVLRAIREIRNIGLSNDWQYFVTFTLDPKKCDRTDYASASKRMTQYFRNLRKQGYPIEYLLIPELHKDYVNWHFHGLIEGIPDFLLTPHPLKSMAEKGYKDFPQFASRFGFVSLSPIVDTRAVVYYCLKYVNKDIFHNRLNDGMRLYYVSRGIKRPQEVFRMECDTPITGFVVDGMLTLDPTKYGTLYSRGLDPDTCKNILNEFLFAEHFNNDAADLPFSDIVPEPRHYQQYNMFEV